MQTEYLHILQGSAEPQGSAMERVKITPPCTVSGCYVTFSALRRDDILWHVPIPLGDSGRAFAM